MPDQDDTQSSEENESGGTTSPATADEGASADNQDSQKKGQSAEGESQEEGGEKKYKLSDGREVSAEELYKVHTQDLLPEFTRRSQKLAELEKQEKERSTRAESETRQTIAENPYLKNVTPEVKEAIIQIVKPTLDASLQQRDQVAAQQEKDRAFKASAEALKKEFPGGDGKPKFDENEVFQAMQEPNNTNFDYRSKFTELYQEEFKDLWVKEALKKQKGGVETERTGGSGPKKPSRKTPRTIQEAGDAFLSRLQQSS